ncbi:hypothetical protein NYE69_12665 [Paenibacillus sp. FSL R5-0527]|uniref:hypothetical protein n=1 Tax=Paenibacillus sp. FSL R5-0527 TaxID=2975321 RepID=UPI00097ABFC7|nr:hypothetical protein BK140_16905 [Paenibacillus macerans]
MAVKTFAEWKAEWKGDLDEFLKEYLQVGDVVDEETVEIFLNLVPPAYWSDNLIQMGLPHDNVNGKATYATLELTAEGWVYRGNCFRGETTALRTD